MNYRLMFIVNAVALAIVGILFMLMPEFVLTQFKSDVYVATIYVARFMGAALKRGTLRGHIENHLIEISKQEKPKFDWR